MGHGPPTLDTANPMAPGEGGEEQRAPTWLSSGGSRGGFGGPRAPHGVRSQDPARQQETEEAAGQRDTSEGTGGGGRAPPCPKSSHRRVTMDRHIEPQETTLSCETGHGQTGHGAPRTGADPHFWLPGWVWPRHESVWMSPPKKNSIPAGGAGALQCLVGAVLRLDELDDEEDHGLDAQHQHDATDEAGRVKAGRVKFGAARQRGAGGGGGL